MSKLQRGLTLLNDATGGFIALLLFGVLLPVGLLMGLGLWNAYQQGFLLPLALVLLSLSLIAFIPRWFYLRKQKRQVQQATATAYVEAAADWSEAELVIWQSLNASISAKLKQNSEWSALKGHGLVLALEIAQKYGKKELDFTVPEGLQLLEEISRQYRRVLNKMVPGIDVLTISQVKFAYELQDKHGSTVKNLYQFGASAWRLLRLANPSTAVLSEIRNKLLGSMTDQAYTNLQYNAKRAFLQEVVKVCINLYSGRFVVETSRVQGSQIHQRDAERLALPLEPVRVAVVGQVSAGKSSLINALVTDVQAETDTLPSTEEARIYPCLVDGEETLRFADMAGLDGSETALKYSFYQILQSDLVLWVLKANQPSRQLDVELQDKLNAYYSRKENIAKKKPRIVVLVNQVDRLKPTDEWSPPYVLEDHKNAKAKIIAEALAFNRDTLSIGDAFYPLAVPPDKDFFGVDTLEAEIQTHYEHAINVQLNRRRLEAGTSEGFAGQAKRLFNVSKEVLKKVW